MPIKMKTPQEYVILNSKEKVFTGEISKGIVLWRLMKISEFEAQ